MPHGAQLETIVRFSISAFVAELADQGAGLQSLRCMRASMTSADAATEGRPPSGPPIAQQLRTAIGRIVRNSVELHRPQTQRARGGLSAGDLRRVRDAIEARLGDAIHVADLAAMVGLSTSHFTRAFRQSTGFSPHRWIMQRRAEEVQRLLALSSQPLADMAVACGFADQSHMTSTFRKIFGVTPGDIRRGRLARQASERRLSSAA